MSVDTAIPTTEPIPVAPAFVTVLEDVALCTLRGCYDGTEAEIERLYDGLGMILDQLHDGEAAVRVSTADVGYGQSVAAYLFDALVDPDFIGECAGDFLGRPNDSSADIRADLVARSRWVEAMAGLIDFVSRLEQSANLGHDEWGNAIALALREVEA